MRLITVAIHTYDRAIAVKSLLEAEGIPVTLQNVNLEQPEVSSGVRIRICDDNLPLALRILENPEIFAGASSPGGDRAIMPHNVVVPTDFSEHSFTAACLAIKIAAAHKVEVTFLHAYIDPHAGGSIQLTDSATYEIARADSTNQLIGAANGMMDIFENRIKDEMKAGNLPMVKFNRLIVEGVPEDAIIDFAKDRPPYLVVMGTRNSADKEKDMIGSVTAEVLDACRFSVMAVPGGETGTIFNDQPANILFFSNLDQEDILAIDTLSRYFPQAKAKVTIINIPSRHRFNDRNAQVTAFALSDYCARKFTHFTFESVPVKPSDAIAEIERMQQLRKFDLLVVPNRRRNVLTRMFNPGIAHRLLFHADLPMLVIPV